MESDKELTKNGQGIFAKYGEEISKACERAVREALLKHKQAGNPIAVLRDGKVVVLQPNEIEVV
jgi:hypothetical protein